MARTALLDQAMPLLWLLRARSWADGAGMPSLVSPSAIAYNPCSERNSEKILATTGAAISSSSSRCRRRPSAALAGLGWGPASAIR